MRTMVVALMVLSGCGGGVAMSDGGAGFICDPIANVCFETANHGALVSTFAEAQAVCTGIGERLPIHGEWLALWENQQGPGVVDTAFQNPITDDNPDGLAWATDVYVASGTDMGPIDDGPGTWSWRFGRARPGERAAAVRCVKKPAN